MYKDELINTLVKVHAKRSGVKIYDGQNGIYKGVCSRGYKSDFNMIQIGDKTINLYDSEIEFLEKSEKPVKREYSIEEKKAELIKNCLKMFSEQDIETQMRSIKALEDIYIIDLDDVQRGIIAQLIVEFKFFLKENKEKALQALLDDLTKSEGRAEQEGWIDADDLERELEQDLKGGGEK